MLEAWAAGNVPRPMGRSPADAVPAIEDNVFAHVLSLAFDFTELMHTGDPCTGSGCDNGQLHAKSGSLVVGASTTLPAPVVHPPEVRAGQAESLAAMFDDYDSTIPATTP